MGLWHMLSLPFGCIICRAGWVVFRFWCGLKLATGCVGSGLLGKKSSKGQGQLLTVSGLGHPGRSSSSWFLPVLGLEVSG